MTAIKDLSEEEYNNVLSVICLGCDADYIGTAAELDALIYLKQHVEAAREGGESNRNTRAYWEFVEAFRELPEIPPFVVIEQLGDAAMTIQGVDTWSIGKEMQRDADLDQIPPRSEYENGAGLWKIIRDAIISARDGESLRAGEQGQTFEEWFAAYGPPIAISGYNVYEAVRDAFKAGQAAQPAPTGWRPIETGSMFDYNVVGGYRKQFHLKDGESRWRISNPSCWPINADPPTHYLDVLLPAPPAQECEHSWEIGTGICVDCGADRETVRAKECEPINPCKMDGSYPCNRQCEIHGECVAPDNWEESLKAQECKPPPDTAEQSGEGESE